MLCGVGYRRSKGLRVKDNVMSGDTPAHAAEGDFAMMPGELSGLLEQIEAEPVPERLLQLALQLQKALADHRVHATRSEELETAF
jgi:hypothetical protein